MFPSVTWENRKWLWTIQVTNTIWPNYRSYLVENPKLMRIPDFTRRSRMWGEKLNSVKMEFLASLAPKPFTGRGNEDADLWLKRLQLFANFHCLTDIRTSHLFGCCMQDDAEIWFHYFCKQQTSQIDLQILQEAFLRRYGNSRPAQQMRTMAALLSRRHGEQTFKELPWR